MKNLKYLVIGLVALVGLIVFSFIIRFVKQQELAGSDVGDRCHISVIYDEESDCYVVTSDWVAESADVVETGILLTQDSRFGGEGTLYVDSPFTEVYKAEKADRVGQFSISIPASSDVWYARSYLRVWDVYEDTFPSYSPVVCSTYVSR